MAGPESFPQCFGSGLIQCSTFAIDVRVEHVSNPKYITTRREGDTILMIVSDRYRLDEPKIQRTLLNLFLRLLQLEAKRYLPSRLEAMELKTGLRATGLKLNSARGRWGSCNNLGSINLSCYLMALPRELIDYIIVHELCHTREMNHGPRFKALWHGFFPNWRELEALQHEYDARTWWLKQK